LHNEKTPLAGLEYSRAAYPRVRGVPLTLGDIRRRFAAVYRRSKTETVEADRFLFNVKTTTDHAIVSKMAVTAGKEMEVLEIKIV